MGQSGQCGPAKTMTGFHAGAITCGTDFGETGVAAPFCFKFKCKNGTVEPIIAQDDAIYWSFPRCMAEGRIHWQGTLWDLSDLGDPHA